MKEEYTYLGWRVREVKVSGDLKEKWESLWQVGMVLGMPWWWRRWEWCWGRWDDGDGGNGAGDAVTVGTVLGTPWRWRRWGWCWGRWGDGDGGDGAGDDVTVETVGMVLGTRRRWRRWRWCWGRCDGGDGAGDVEMMETVEMVLGTQWRWGWCWGRRDDGDGGHGAGRDGGHSASSCSYGGAGKMLVTQFCPTLCDPMDHRLPGSSVHEILQARVLEWGAIPFSRGSSWPRDRTWWWWWCFQLFIWKDREESGDWGEGKPSPSTLWWHDWQKSPPVWEERVIQRFWSQKSCIIPTSPRLPAGYSGAPVQRTCIFRPSGGRTQAGIFPSKRGKNPGNQKFGVKYDSP